MRNALIAAAALAVTLAGPVAAGNQVPFKGTLAGTATVTPLGGPIVAVEINATGTATYLGKFTLVAFDELSRVLQPRNYSSGRKLAEQAEVVWSQLIQIMSDPVWPTPVIASGTLDLIDTLELHNPRTRETVAAAKGNLCGAEGCAAAHGRGAGECRHFDRRPGDLSSEAVSSPVGR